MNVMEGKKKKRELPTLAKNQNRIRSDSESEQVGWIAFVLPACLRGIGLRSGTPFTFTDLKL